MTGLYIGNTVEPLLTGLPRGNSEIRVTRFIEVLSSEYFLDWFNDFNCLVNIDNVGTIIINVCFNIFNIHQFSSGLVSNIVFSRRKSNYMYQILVGRLKGIRTKENSLIGTTKRWAWPLKGCSREIFLTLIFFLKILPLKDDESAMSEM